MRELTNVYFSLLVSTRISFEMRICSQSRDGGERVTIILRPFWLSVVNRVFKNEKTLQKYLRQGFTYNLLNRGKLL